MRADKQIKIAIVDDHTLFRQGLKQLIRLIDADRYFLLFEVQSAEEMVARLDRIALPEIVIMDIVLPGMTGFDAVDWLKRHYPQIKVLVISMATEEEAIMRMIRLGVRGYLSKDVEMDELQAALAKISAGGFHYTDFITGRLIGSLQDTAAHDANGPANPSAPDLWGRLKEREREFVRLACSELTYEEIAERMCLSTKTVEGYSGKVYTKMGVKNRVGLVLAAIRHKLVTL